MIVGGVLDAQVHIGRETTYGVAVTPTRSFEALADIGEAQREALQSVGMRAGLQTVRSDRRRNYIKGGEGSLELHPLNSGFGMLLRAAIGTASSTGPGGSVPSSLGSGATIARFDTASGAPNESLTVVVGRPPADPAAAVIPWTYTGGVVHAFSLEQEVGDGDDGQLKATFELDYNNELVVGDAGAQTLPAAAYPAADFVYGWPDLTVTIDGGAVGDTRTFNLEMDHGVNRERYYMRGSTLKKRPIRTEVPEFSGSLSFDYENNTVYEYVRSSEVVPLVAEWKGPQIGAGPHFHTLRVTCNVQFTGASPQVSLDDLPNQPIEFMCLHDGNTPAVRVEYISADTNF